MHFAIVALLASSAVSAAAPRLPAAPSPTGRSATTITVTGADDDAVVLLEALAQPAADACAGAPVALNNTNCQVTFQCSEAAATDADVFEAAQGQLASAVGPVAKSCVCTCGTYCCPLCNFVVPETVQVEDIGLTVTCD